jgi:hypothetical protein
MHKTQGFGNFGAAQFGSGGPRQNSFIVLDGEPATNDIMDGIDTTFRRFQRGDALAKLAEEAIAQFKPDDPAASLPTLLAMRRKLGAQENGSFAPDAIFSGTATGTRINPLIDDPVGRDKFAQLDRIVRACLGLTVETTLANAEVVPGEKIPVHSTATVRSNVPVRWRVFTPADRPPPENALSPGQPVTLDFSVTVPENARLSQPYWLREESSAGLFRVSPEESFLIGNPENPPPLQVFHAFEVGGQYLEFSDPLVQRVPGAPAAQAQRQAAIIPPVSLGFPYEVELFAPGATKTTVLEVTAARADSAGKLQLNPPAGWKVSPASQDFKLERVGDKARLTFDVTAPVQPASGTLTASAEINGRRFDNSRVVINYPHLPVMLLQPPARLKLAAFTLATRGRNIGYLPGAGDSIAENLEQMGYAVTTLTGADLTPEKLNALKLDAVVIGVRAFNERKDLAANLPGLFAWVEAGGTVVAQYNRPANSLPPLAPYKLSIAGPAPQLRITDENSPVTFFAPDHVALNRPNKITAADFEGWVQERGAYFPSSWDEQHFTPLLSMSDPGEAALRSSILVAQHGKGYYVYTGLAFFRQLPAGVPGAYRLFANLVSLGKE